MVWEEGLQLAMSPSLRAGGWKTLALRVAGTKGSWCCRCDASFPPLLRKSRLRRRQPALPPVAAEISEQTACDSPATAPWGQARSCRSGESPLQSEGDGSGAGAGGAALAARRGGTLHPGWVSEPFVLS